MLVFKKISKPCVNLKLVGYAVVGFDSISAKSNYIGSILEVFGGLHNTRKDVHSHNMNILARAIVCSTNYLQAFLPESVQFQSSTVVVQNILPANVLLQS